MGLINLRDLLQFPPGDNATDTVVNGVHFNKTALDLFNYTIYSNGTISNKTKCYLIFDTYQPMMLSNGSWYNATSCYVPYYGINTRGKLNIAFASCFGISIMFTLMNLRKHGKMYIREDKRFRIVGRRWSWYWLCFVAACAMIGCITGVDIDRNYLQSLPIVLQGLFFSLMLPGILAAVWESTRHWGSFQERQICDRDPFLLPQDDRRAKVEFYLPLIFYLFAWLNFFMVIPRSWTNIEYQRSVEQEEDVARPSGTDTRLKVGALLAICAWIVIIVSLWHSIKVYKPDSASIGGKLTKFIRHCSLKHVACIVILGVRLAYGVLSAWSWDTSILKWDVNPVWPFALGFAPILIVVIILEVAGFIEENEDKVILRQRRERGAQYDRDLGITRKPNWWSKLNGDPRYMNTDARLKAMTTLGGGEATGRNVVANVELSTLSNVRNRSRSRPTAESLASDPFRDRSPSDTISTTHTGGAAPRAGISRLDSDAASTATGATGATGMTGRTLTENAPPQQIRSMLDV